MAEGWARSLWADSVESFSAGTKPQGVNPLAVKAMGEAGIDISRHTSKHLDSLSDVSFDLVVTVCDNAAAHCPMPPPGTKVIHAPFDDPPHLARDCQTESEALPHYRRVRDEIKTFMSTLPSLVNDIPPKTS